MQLMSTPCEACKIDSPAVNETEKNQLLLQIPQWKILNIDQIERLSRSYKFINFVKAMEFTNRVAEIAEVENHHPEIITQWGQVTVVWWTHTIKGLHINDFVLAARTEQLFNH